MVLHDDLDGTSILFSIIPCLEREREYEIPSLHFPALTNSADKRGVINVPNS